MAMILLLALLSIDPPAAPVPVPCRTVADCWLDEEGRPVPRPPRLRGRPLPLGNCGKNLVWLRHRLTCEAQVCTAVRVGDRC